MGGGGPVADLPGQRTDQHEGKFTPYVAMVTLVAVSVVPSCTPAQLAGLKGAHA